LCLELALSRKCDNAERRQRMKVAPRDVSAAGVDPQQDADAHVEGVREMLGAK